MDAVKFIEERNRMCNSFESCSNCPLNKEGIFCYASMEKHSQVSAEEVVQLVEEWTKESPRKTRQDVFLEQWPNAKVFVDGVLDICPLELDECYTCQSTDLKMRCQSCRRDFWMQVVK